MSSTPTAGHQHLDGDAAEAAEAAAERYLESGELPGCEVCSAEVQELARYLSAGQLLGRRHAYVPGTPGADAIRVLRRRTYPRRALAAVVSTLTPAGITER